jgi:hypothetical protein
LCHGRERGVPGSWRIGWQRLGFAALTIGLLLVIIYAEIFAYR